MKDVLMLPKESVLILIGVVCFILGLLVSKHKYFSITYATKKRIEETFLLLTKIIKKIGNSYLLLGPIIFTVSIMILYFITKNITYIITMTFLYFAIYILIGIRFIAEDCKNIDCKETRCDLTITRSYAKASMILFITSGIIGILTIITDIVIKVKE